MVKQTAQSQIYPDCWRGSSTRKPTISKFKLFYKKDYEWHMILGRVHDPDNYHCNQPTANLQCKCVFFLYKKKGSTGRMVVQTSTSNMQPCGADRKRDVVFTWTSFLIILFYFRRRVKNSNPEIRYTQSFILNWNPNPLTVHSSPGLEKM